MITVLYFAWLRERLGRDRDSLDVPDGATVATVLAGLRALSPAHDAALASRSIRCAVNQAFAPADAPVRPGDEVAFFPPVTGG